MFRSHAVTLALTALCSLIASSALADPITDSSLRVWLRADAINGLTDGEPNPLPANGSPVGTWTDSSGNNNHATQATAAKQPLFITEGLYGRPALRFDGINDNNLGDQLVLGNLSTQFTTAATLFVVATIDETLAGDQYNIYTTRNNDSYWAKPANGTQNNRLGTFLLNRDDNYPLLGVMPYDGDHIFVIEADGNTRYQVWIDGQTPGFLTGKTFAGGDMHQIGGDSGSSSQKYLRGDISEIIIYDRILSEAEFAQVNHYLNTKYFPEPGSLALLAIGGVTLLRGRRR